MSRVLFTSDLHFGHKSLCEGLRGMTSNESDELIIENWNKTVLKKDIVYILGDITMENPDLIYINLSQLRGNIRIVGGNHDTLKCCEVFARMGIPVLGALEYKGFICTHVPVDTTQVGFYKGNIHGHIHNKGRICLPTGEIVEYDTRVPLHKKYFNVNCELHNYTPILFDEIVKRISIE